MNLHGSKAKPKKSKGAKAVRSLRSYRGQEITRASAIRLHCLDCCLNQSNEICSCKAYSCPLWGYRMGKKWQQGIPFLNHDAAMAADNLERDAGVAFFGKNVQIGTLLVDAFLATGTNTYLAQEEELIGILLDKNAQPPVQSWDASLFFGQKVTRRAAIRLKCLDCRSNERIEVRRCDFYGCPLWPYRMGGKWEKNETNNSKSHIGSTES